MTEQVFVARFSRSRLLLLILCCLAFSAAGLVLLGVIGQEWAVQQPNILHRLVGAFALVFFGGFGLRYLRHLLSRGIALRIDGRGIMDLQQSPDIIAWEDICYFSTWSRSSFFGMLKQHHLVYKVRRDSDYQRSLFQQWNEGLNKMFMGHTHVLQHRSLDRSLQDIAKALNSIPPDQVRLRWNPQLD